MSTTRTLAAQPTVNEDGIWYNRQQIDAARNLRDLRSWLPVRDDAPTVPDQSRDEVADEDLQKIDHGMDEVGGFGSRTANQDADSILDSLPGNRSRAAMDKLFQQMTGRKPAPTGKTGRTVASAGNTVDPSTQKASQSLRTSKVIAKPQQDVQSSEDEGGRTSMLASRKQKSQNSKSTSSDMFAADVASETQEALASSKAGVERQPISTRRKAGSYLDEVLEQTARKKAKKKQKQNQE